MQKGRRGQLQARMLALGAASAFALVHGGEPSGEAILRNVQSRMAEVRDYTVHLDVVADIERLNVPEMHVTMYFKQPDKVHLDAEGFAMLPREGLALNVEKLLSRYFVEHVERDTVAGGSLYRLTLAARSERTAMRSMQLEIQPDRWTIERVSTGGPGDRTVNVTFRYAQVEGHWLPEQMTARFSVAPADTSGGEGVEGPAPFPPRQVPRNGTVTVHYSSYHINTGLSDEIFTKDPSRPPE